MWLMPDDRAKVVQKFVFLCDEIILRIQKAKDHSPNPWWVGDALHLAGELEKLSALLDLPETPLRLIYYTRSNPGYDRMVYRIVETPLEGRLHEGTLRPNDDGRAASSVCQIVIDALNCWKRYVVSPYLDDSHANTPDVKSPDPVGMVGAGCSESKPEPAKPAMKPKRSTVPGEARTKLISALTKHHKYSTGSCLNWDSVGNNELARLAEVEKSTASAFFLEQFGGYSKYKIFCKNKAKILGSLAQLNGELTPGILFTRLPDEHADAESDDDGDD